MSIGLVFCPAVQVGSSRDDLLANDTIADAAMHCDMQNQQMPDSSCHSLGKQVGDSRKCHPLTSPHNSSGDHQGD